MAPGGADLVLELPAAFACSSAEEFAACGVVSSTGLNHRLSVFWKRTWRYVRALKGCGNGTGIRSLFRTSPERTENGATFPAARQTALKAIYSDSQDAEFLDLLSAPNNILGLEYCKAILRQKASLRPFAILRKGDGYHDTISSIARNPARLPLHLPLPPASGLPFSSSFLMAFQIFPAQMLLAGFLPFPFFRNR